MSQRGQQMRGPGAGGPTGPPNQGQQQVAWVQQMQNMSYYHPQQPMMMRPMSNSPHGMQGGMMYSAPYANAPHGNSQRGHVKQNPPTHGQMQQNQAMYAANHTTAMQRHPNHQQMMQNQAMPQRMDMQMTGNNQMLHRQDAAGPDQRQNVNQTGNMQPMDASGAPPPKQVTGTPTQVPSPGDTTNQTTTNDTPTPQGKARPRKPINPLVIPQIRPVQANAVVQQAQAPTSTPSSPHTSPVQAGSPTQPPRPVEPIKPDLCMIDCGKYFEPLAEALNFDSAPEPSGPPLDVKFEQFGNAIAGMLQQQAQILETSQLQASDADAAIAEGSMVNVHKLNTMTEASAALFANISTLSQQMHEMVDKLPPFYTRSSHYFRNLEIKADDVISFSHTHVPEAAVSAHLVRLQDELLKRHAPPSP
ncbi:hypothetical protein, conserved [Babesia ovata]|uniref:Uncharacterized protein n=1 Tax=Babesia ovata TaxID=189622 RepID=A0A2H6KDZ7_9APIC|nr:uncharacterized protein BOVATA_027080 [Babesia ovata]GBE61215.1 hypothetical protein, conserved [Babesia ovata]